MNWNFGLGSSRHSNCSNALYTGTKRAVKIIFHLGKSLISSLSFYTKFLCFTSSLTQTHSFFSNCKETKQLILMQSKVRSQIFSANKHANWSLFFSFVLVVVAVVIWVLSCCWYLFCGLDHEKHWKKNVISYWTRQTWVKKAGRND